jgi:type II secretory pathway component PulJ
MNNKGFSLLETIISVQILLLALTFSSFSLKELLAHEKKIHNGYQDMEKIQDTMETLKHSPWAEVVTDQEKGVTVLELNAHLKQIKVSGNTLILETIIKKN